MDDFEQLSDTHREDVQAVIPTVWAKKIETAARPMRVFREHIRFDNSLLNKPGDEVRIPRRSELTAAAIGEAGTITPSTLTYSTALVLTPTEYGVAVSLSRQAISRANENLIEAATTELAQALSQIEDTTIRDELNQATSNQLYCGSATGTADITVTDVLTPEKLTLAARELRKNNWNPTDIFLSPEQQYSLGTCIEFTNSASWGNREVITKGVIPQWMGMKVHTTTNVPSGLGGTAVDVAYHTAFCMDSKAAGAIAIKRNISVDVQYEPLSRKRTIAATLDFDSGIINDSAICTITSADGA
ncbi:hypothetical protein ES703_51407 [subsurface metagenome]